MSLRRGFLLGLALLTLAAVATCAVVGPSGDSPESAAISACHGFVAERLSSPESSRFAGDDKAHIAAQVATVNGTVTTGGTARSYACRAHYDGRWQLLSLDWS